MFLNLSAEDWFKTFLMNWGQAKPDDLNCFLQKINLTPLQLEIMRCRYIYGLRFKEISPHVKYLDDRYIFKQHKKAIEKTLERVDLAVYNE